jgi:hypothetical protein
MANDFQQVITACLTFLFATPAMNLCLVARTLRRGACGVISDYVERASTLRAAQ